MYAMHVIKNIKKFLKAFQKVKANLELCRHLSK